MNINIILATLESLRYQAEEAGTTDELALVREQEALWERHLDEALYERFLQEVDAE